MDFLPYYTVMQNIILQLLGNLPKKMDDTSPLFIHCYFYKKSG